MRNVTLILFVFLLFTAEAIADNAQTESDTYKDALVENNPTDDEAAYAEDSTLYVDATNEQKILIAEILEGKDFKNVTTTGGWYLKELEEDEGPEKTPEWLIALIKLLEKLFSENEGGNDIDVGAIIEILLWLLAAAFVVVIAFFLWKSSKSWRMAQITLEKEREKPKTLFGLDVTNESLPDDVAGEALSLWHSQDQRQALALLYRASLARLMHDKGLVFNDSHTEGECLTIVEMSQLTEHMQFFRQLTGSWINLAYGHQLPPEAEVISLCNQWRERFNHEE